jgi:hypothetical protein
MYRIQQTHDIPDNEWLGYQSLIFEGRKKRAGYSWTNGHFISKGFEGFTGEPSLTVFPSIGKARVIVTAPKWLDLATYVKELGRPDDYAYISLNGQEHLLAGCVEEIAPEVVILASDDEGLAHDIAEWLDRFDVVFGIVDLKKKRPPQMQKAFYEPVIKPQGTPKFGVT